MTHLVDGVMRRGARAGMGRICSGAWAMRLAWAALVPAVLRLLYAPYEALYHGTGADFIAFLTGARILSAGGRCLYCLSAQADAQAAILGYRPTGAGFPHTFANAPLSAWLLQPLAHLDRAVAQEVFTVASAVAAAMAGILVFQLLTGFLTRDSAAFVALGAAATLPAAAALQLAQWDPFLMLALAGALHLGRSGAQFRAGLLLSVLVIKPQVCLLVLPALLAGRAWRTGAGFAVGACVWWGSGFALAGPHALSDLATLIQQTQANEGATTAGIPGLAALGGGTSAVMPAGALLGAVAIGALVAMRGRLTGDPELAIGLGVTLSLAIAPHVFSDDLALLATAFVLLALRMSVASAVAAIAVTNICFLADDAIGYRGRPAEAVWLTVLAVGLLVLAVRGRLPRRGPDSAMTPGNELQHRRLPAGGAADNAAHAAQRSVS